MAAIQQFEITYQGPPAQVAEYSLKSSRVFRVEFAQRSRRPLVITVADDDEGKKFWTSVPEGRQELAEEVGRLVAFYVKSNRDKKLSCVTTTDKKLPVLSLFD